MLGACREKVLLASDALGVPQLGRATGPFTERQRGGGEDAVCSGARVISARGGACHPHSLDRPAAATHCIGWRRGTRRGRPDVSFVGGSGGGVGRDGRRRAAALAGGRDNIWGGRGGGISEGGRGEGRGEGISEGERTEAQVVLFVAVGSRRMWRSGGAERIPLRKILSAPFFDGRGTCSWREELR